MSFNSIYKITFPTNKLYIGKTSKTVQQRFKQHTWTAKRRSENKRTRIQNAIIKYGEENLIIEVLFQTECEWFAYEIEKLFIKFFDTCNIEKGYNISTGGDCGPDRTGSIQSPESRKKTSNSLSGRKNPMYGKENPRTKEWKQNHSEFMKNNNPFKGKNHKLDTCKYCKKTFSVPMVTRWHNEKCKLSPGFNCVEILH